MIKVNLENPFLARPKSVKIGRSYWQAQSKAPTILKQKDKWVKQQNDRNYKAFRNYLQTEGARALNKEVKDYLTTSNDNTWTSANRNPKNPHLQARATKGAKSHALWEKEHPTLTKWGNVLGAAPFAVASAPLAAAVGSGAVALGDAAAATAIGQGVTNFLAPIAGTSIAGASIPQWLDLGLTSAFGANGIQTAINEGEISPTTALEIAPLGRLARPIYNFGKEGIDAATRYASPSYDLYRSIGETTPNVRVRDPYINIKGLRGTDKSYIKIKSSLENLADAKRGNKNEAYYLFAPKDIDILKLRNARFGNGKSYDGPILGSGSVDGKFVSYGEPWMEFAPNEKTALYEMPTGPKRGPNLMATDFRGNKMDYSVNEAYNTVLRDRQFHKDIKNIKLGDILKFKRDNYPDLIGGIPTDIYHANQTVIPNKNWNFDKFLKTPLWKYSEDPISGQVQKELMMKLPESKPIEAPTIEWKDAVSTTPKVNWDADNWFKAISGRSSYSSEEAAELASNVPEYRAIEQRLFDEGKLTLDSNGNAIVIGSKMSPQEYIMRQSKAFQKMNPEHHYVGVSKSLRNSFENESRDPATKNRYEVWTDRKSPKNVEEYAESQQGGTTTDSHIKNLQDDMSIKEENYNLHQAQLKWKYEHGKISKDYYNQNLKLLKDNYDKKQNEVQKELDVLVQQKQKYPLNGGKVFDVTYPKETIETPIINAENNHWANIPFDNVVRDAPNVVTHYKQRPYSNKLQTDQIISAARRNGYGVTHIDNVMDTYNGELLNETIIGRDTPVKSVLGNTGNFDINSSNKWKLYRSLVPPFLSLGTLGSIYKTNKRTLGGSIPFYNPKRKHK